MERIHASGGGTWFTESDVFRRCGWRMRLRDRSGDLYPESGEYLRRRYVVHVEVRKRERGERGRLENRVRRAIRNVSRGFQVTWVLVTQFHHSDGAERSGIWLDFLIHQSHLSSLSFNKKCIRSFNFRHKVLFNFA